MRCDPLIGPAADRRPAEEDGDMKRSVLCLAAMLLACTGAAAETPLTFQGQTVTMIIGFAAGGGTDIAGRLIAPYLAKHLPGSPNIIVQNRPGADGISATNYFAQQAKPDGLTLNMGASTITDPINYRKSQAQYDPSKFHFIGGVGRGGSALVINVEAEKRLFDKNERPAIMGSPGGVPHSTMQATAWGMEFLGWNAKWVTGYRGTSDLFIALDRGEIDMSATGNLSLISQLVSSGRFKVLVQTGTLEKGKIVARSEFGNAPVFAALMEGKIKEPVQQKGYDYWYSLLTTDKWLALPPGTPEAIVAAYREAFRKLATDADFLDRAKKVSQDFEMQPASDVEILVKTLDDTPPEAFDYISGMLRKQGLQGG
jgi:tripartite-type tricarboxylate transporter receptor subunit TctC